MKVVILIGGLGTGLTLENERTVCVDRQLKDYLDCRNK